MQLAITYTKAHFVIIFLFMQFVENFLKKCKVPTNKKIYQKPLLTFIADIVDRFPGSSQHYFLHDFICKISQGYVKDGCPTKFVADLFQLQVPKLFSRKFHLRVDVDQCVNETYAFILLSYVV